MIKQPKNTPVSAPQFSNMDVVLDKFRTFRDEPAMQMQHLVDFLSVPGADRTAFFELFTLNVEVISSRFAVITYE